MSEPEPVELREPIPVVPRPAAPHPRPVGAPLSVGAGNRQTQAPTQINGKRLAPAPAPGRALPGAVASEEHPGLHRAMNAFKTMLPIVKGLLPLLDGNVGTAVANLMLPRPNAQTAPPKVDLVPLESGLAELQTQHRTLHDQVLEQSTSLKRVEDRLEAVREATDRNTLEQQELLEDLKAFSGKVKVIAVVGIGLLAAGILLELIMFLHLQRVLP